MNTDISTCWKEVGVWGDHTCQKLTEHIHCRNCPVFSAAGRTLLDRPPSAEYLNEWSEDLARVKAHRQTGDQCTFIFRLGSEFFGLPVHRIVEIMEVKPIRIIPHRKSQILKGLVSIRGQLQIYISLHALLGITQGMEVDPKTQARMCIIEQDSDHWVFTLDESLGIHRYVGEDIHPLPTTLDKATSRYTDGLLHLSDDGPTVGLLNLSNMINTISKSIRK